MAKNSFTVTASDTSLTGTVLLSMRSQNPAYPSRIVEVDRTGKVVWEFKLTPDVAPGGAFDIRKLPNGDVLFDAVTTRGEGTDPLIGAKQNWIIEVDRAGHVVRKLQTGVTHHAEQLANGNYLVVDEVSITVRELDPAGRVVWSWDPRDHIKPFDAETYANFNATPTVQDVYSLGYERPGIVNYDWIHVNSAQRLPNGNTLISLRNLDLVVEVNRAGSVVWTYGALVIKHQHCAWDLGNGHILITDNGNARIIEVDRTTQQIVWEYSGGLNLPFAGCAYRQPNGNTFITDSGNLRVLEVSPDKRVVWQLKITTPATTALYRAWWSP